MPEISPEAQSVRDALVKSGLENPYAPNGLSPEEKKAAIEDHVRGIMGALGLDLKDDSLENTPRRIAKMYVDEIFSGLDYANFPKITLIENKMHVDEMVKVCDITVTSTCEHHFVTIDGKAKVAYMPKKRIIGLSKINRIVKFFARRPQVQERLTQQILVTICATHYCVKARGVEDASSFTQTTALGGYFKTNAASRHEFLSDTDTRC